jgi:hypothetical protein
MKGLGHESQKHSRDGIDRKHIFDKIARTGLQYQDRRGRKGRTRIELTGKKSQFLSRSDGFLKNLPLRLRRPSVD